MGVVVVVREKRKTNKGDVTQSVQSTPRAPSSRRRRVLVVGAYFEAASLLAPKAPSFASFLVSIHGFSTLKMFTIIVAKKGPSYEQRVYFDKEQGGEPSVLYMVCCYKPARCMQSGHADSRPIRLSSPPSPRSISSQPSPRLLSFE